MRHCHFARFGLVLALALLALMVAGPTTGPQPAVAQSAASGDPGGSPELDEHIRSRIVRNGSAAAVIAVGSERLHAAAELPRFYERRGFRPAWVGEAGRTALADSLIVAVGRAEREGLRSGDYHLARIRAVLAELREGRRLGTPVPATRLADLDLLLTDAFLLYGAHLVGGRVDPVSMHPEWSATRREADLVAVLDSALATGRVGASLESLLPEHPEYARLRATLDRYRRIARGGGLPELPGRSLPSGARDEAVPLLRQWVRQTGDLEASAPVPADSMLLDPALADAVRRVQTRLGLPATGSLTLETGTLMNTPVEERIRQLEVNMERWRWLPRDLGDRHVRVNIAGFYLNVFEGDSVALSTRVMVGQRYRMTPVFSDRITYLVLNPTWTIPPGILEKDKLPLIRRDPVTYLRSNRIRVLDTGGREVDPATVDWSRVSGTTSYRLRMDPGPQNPLGQVKFMFPNAYSVYLHDTPSRELFDRARRDFSSGCIRVERPLDLAAYLLRDDARWSRERIDTALRNTAEQTVPLSRSVPVHLLYWTSWVDGDGLVHFRDDIYDRDAPLVEALREAPPGVPTPTAARP